MDCDVMGENRTLKRIGGKLREESRDIVDARLPEKLRLLLDRLACTDRDCRLNSGRTGH